MGTPQYPYELDDNSTLLDDGKLIYVNDTRTAQRELRQAVKTIQAFIGKIGSAVVGTIVNRLGIVEGLAHTQGTDQTLDDGGANEVAVADVKDSVDKKHSQNTDTGTSNATFAINGANAIVEGDFRLTDARTPTSHGNDKHSSTYAIASGFSNITVGTTEPESPTTGDIWLDIS